MQFDMLRAITENLKTILIGVVDFTLLFYAIIVDIEHIYQIIMWVIVAGTGVIRLVNGYLDLKDRIKNKKKNSEE